MKMALDFRFPHVLFKTFSRLCTLLGEFAGNEPNVCLFLFFALTQAINHNDIDQFFVCF